MPAIGDVGFDELQACVASIDTRTLSSVLAKLTMLGLVELSSGERYKRLTREIQ